MERGALDFFSDPERGALEGEKLAGALSVKDFFLKIRSADL